MKKFLLIFSLLFTNLLVSQTSTDCELKKEVDKFTSDTTVSTPFFDKSVGEFNKVSFKSTIKKNGEKTLRCILYNTSDNIYRGKGVFILFEDGTKIEKPECEVQSRYSSGSFSHISIFTINEEDSVIFSTKRITDIRMYLLDATIPLKSGEKIRNYFNCIK